MFATLPFMDTEIQQFVKDWFSKLDVHAPSEALLSMLSDEQLKMHFPEKTIYSQDDFTEWYTEVTRKYFDEVHILRKVQVHVSPEQTEVQLVVNWQASAWQSPQPGSKREAYDAYQNWVIKRSPKSNHPVIVSYMVEKLIPVPLSDELTHREERAMQTREIIIAYYEAVNSANWEKWLTLFAENIVAEDQIAGRAEGLDALRGAVEGIKCGYSKFQMHPLQIVIENDQAAVVWHCVAANAKGVPIDAHGANYFRVENGKIAYLADYHDTKPFEPFINQE